MTKVPIWTVVAGCSRVYLAQARAWIECNPAHHVPKRSRQLGSKVEDGFDDATAKSLLVGLERLVSKRCPLANPPHKPKARWLEPLLVANIVHRGGLGPTRVRHAKFEGFAEAPQKRRTARPSHRRMPSPAVPAENILQLLPDAVVPSGEELQSYWQRVASTALVHLGRRPLKLVRHFEGTTYYHKGPLPPVRRAVHRLRIRKRDGSEGVRLCVDDL